VNQQNLPHESSESAVCLTLLATLIIAACGEQKPAEEQLGTPTEVAEAPAATTLQQSQGFGFGPVTIRVSGTVPKPGANYIGDCVGGAPDHDFGVMSFSAPWKIVGYTGGGPGRAEHGLRRSFTFEKNPDAAGVDLRLAFLNERRDRTAADLTAGYPKVADLAFSPGSVGLYRSNDPDLMLNPYVAVFPLVDVEGKPYERELTSRVLATVELYSTGLPEFYGWSEGEIIQLFESFYTARCVGEDFMESYAAVDPTLIFE